MLLQHIGKIDGPQKFVISDYDICIFGIFQVFSMYQRFSKGGAGGYV